MQEQQLAATDAPAQQLSTLPVSEAAVIPTIDPKKRVFLAWTPADALEKRELVAVMLIKAGFDIIPKEPKPEDEATFKKKVNEYMGEAAFSIHVLGGEYGRVLSDDPGCSWSRYQYDLATQRSKESKGEFKRVSWSYPLEGVILQGDQADLITTIQNNISSEVMFTNVSNPAQLIDDLRGFLEKDLQVKAVPKEYDIAFFSNVADAADCYMTIEKLSEEFKLTTVTIVPENDTDYRELGADRALKSRLAVIYFKESADWAIAFVKQVWKYVGGASSSTSFYLIGEDEPRRNRFLRYKAPNTLMQVVQQDEVLETVRTVYQRFRETGRLTEETFCPYTGLRPFNEDESIFFKGRDKHNDYIIEMIARQKFAMVTGASGDGKSSLIYAGVVPTLKGGFLKTQFSKWAVADFRPERQPLRNMALALSREMRLKDIDDVENALSYGFSALVDLYKKSPLYCDLTSPEWMDAAEEDRKTMKRRAANLVVLVDQFEEFFTNEENYREGVASPIAQIAVNVLIETVRIAREENLPIYVICTMRSDYIGQCVAFRGFAEMIGLSTYYVPRLKREEVQEVIQAPAALNGNKVSLRLAQRLLNDLGDGIDQLPVLQHSLHQIWTSADRGATEMDLIHYAKVGGLSVSKLPKEYVSEFEAWFRSIGEIKQSLYATTRLKNVLNRHANELYEFAHDYYNERYSPDISKEQAQAIIKSAFTCLTKVDEGRAVRNRVSLQQITDIHGQDAVSSQMICRVLNIFREQGNTFVQPFITDDPESNDLVPSTVLDITHESLIRNWERLVDWAEAEEKSVSVYRDFKVQVDRWLNNDCDPKYLLGPGPFNFFNTWYEQQMPTPAWIRRYMSAEEVARTPDPIEESQLYLEDIQDFLKQSKEKINRAKVIRNIVTAVIIGLMLLATYGFFDAQFQAAEAKNQAKVAQQEKLKADEERKKAVAAQQIAEEEKRNATIARDQALTAQQRAELEKQRAEEQRKLADYNKLQAQKESERANQQATLAEREAENAKREKVAADKARAEAEQSAIVAEEQGRVARTESRNAKILQSLFLSSLSRDQVKLEKPETGVQLSLQALPADINNPTDRPYVAEAEASLYNAMDAIVNKQPKKTLTGHRNKMIYNVFSPDSRTLVSSSWDKTARVWDVATGQQRKELSGHANVVEKAYFSQDGRFTITLGEDFSARLWDINSAKQLQTFRGHKDDITHVVISPDGQRVLTSSLDGTARLWDAQTGNTVAELVGHKGPVLHCNISDDGKYIVTTSEDKTAMLWNGQNGTRIAELPGHTAAVRYGAFSPDNSMLATVSDDNTGRIWNATNGGLIKVLSRGTILTGIERNGHVNAVNYANFSPDSRRLATASSDSLALVWNVTVGKVLGTLKGHSERVYNVQFSNDNRFMLTTSDDNTVRLWDAEHYLELSKYVGTPGLGYYAVFSPDSKMFATAGGLESSVFSGDIQNDYSIRLYELLPKGQNLVEFAKSKKLPDLNENEKKIFFLTDKRITKVELEKNIKDYNDRMKMLKPNEAPVKMPEKQPAPAPKGGPSMPQGSIESGKGEHRTHRVQPGETLYCIARRYNETLAELLKLNGKTAPTLQAGELLIVKR